MIRALLIAGAVLSLLVIHPIALPAGEGQLYTDAATGLSFRLPPNFSVTRFQDTPHLQPGIRAVLPNVIVLTERRFHATKDPISIGSFPTITVDVLTGERAKFNQLFFKPEFSTTIRGHAVYELPVTNGPKTQQLFYYLVPVSPERIIEIAGHRYYFERGKATEAGQPTRYDAVIAEIIGSLNPQTL